MVRTNIACLATIMAESWWKFHWNSSVFHQNYDRISIWFPLEFHWKLPGFKDPIWPGEIHQNSGAFPLGFQRNFFRNLWKPTGIPVVSHWNPGGFQQNPRYFQPNPRNFQWNMRQFHQIYWLFYNG